MEELLEYHYNDGGRSKYFKGTAGDCCCRAITIATGMDYKEVYDLVNKFAKEEKPSKRRRGLSSARNGVHKITMQKIMDYLGFTWVPCMHIGSGCTTHLRRNEIPMDKTIIVNLSRHFSCIVNGVVNDTFDCTRDGNRCVYGYWVRER